MSSYSVIIPAAGSGSRMGAPIPKVLLSVPNHSKKYSVVRHTVELFHSDSRCERIVVCHPAEWRGEFETQVRDMNKVELVCGGQSRQESVFKGIEVLIKAKPSSISEAVLVHDAARCCLDKDTIQSVLDGVKKYGAVTAAVPAVDSLCCVDESECIVSYIERSTARAIQTPQGFILRELREAHVKALDDGYIGLDDASIMARLREVRIVAGSKANIKVTTPEDMVALKAFFENQEELNG